MRPKRHLVLQVGFEEELVETRGGLGRLGRPPREDLRRLIQTIRRAAADRRVSGLLLKMSQPALGWAKAASLARVLQEFRAAGKPTVAFLEGAGNADFALACACESVVMPPGATLYVSRLRAEVFFLKDLLDAVGIEAELEVVGEYKSAGESFLRREMSAAHREEIEFLLEDLSRQMLNRIGEGRSLDSEKLRALIEGGPYLAKEAAEVGLIDRVAHEDTCQSLLEESTGAEVTLLPHERYSPGDGLFTRLLTPRRPRIAIVYAVGLITSGDERRRRAPRQTVGARALATTLKRVRESRRVKAVVLRIESPGGGAAASELIWRQLDLTRHEKPVVVSMGDVAASGGYYIATAADAIIAEASTLTGSIGILGGKFVARRLLDKLGVHREAVGGPSSFLSPFHLFSKEDREKLGRHLRHFYDELFVPRVAEGRRLPVERVHEVARGRIWTGEQAKERGLVDEIGGLDAAIEWARGKAGIPPGKKVRVVTYAKRPRLLDLMPLPVPFADTRIGSNVARLLDLVEIVSREDVLYLMPAWIDIR